MKNVKDGSNVNNSKAGNSNYNAVVKEYVLTFTGLHQAMMDIKILVADSILEDLEDTVFKDKYAELIDILDKAIVKAKAQLDKTIDPKKVTKLKDKIATCESIYARAKSFPDSLKHFKG